MNKVLSGIARGAPRRADGSRDREVAILHVVLSFGCQPDKHTPHPKNARSTDGRFQTALHGKDVEGRLQ